MGFLGVLRVKMWNIVFWPPKGTTLLEYASVDVSHVKIGSTAWALGPWKYFAYKEERKKKWVVTLAIWGEVTSGTTLTICGVWGDMVDVITCAIFGDCRLRGVGVVRGVNLPSPIDFTCRPYNTGHTTVWPCDENDAAVDGWDDYTHRSVEVYLVAIVWPIDCCTYWRWWGFQCSSWWCDFGVCYPPYDRMKRALMLWFLRDVPFSDFSLTV